MSRGGNVARSGAAVGGFIFLLPRAAMERQEIDLVLDRRARFRASWQHCAAMVDRSVHDVRMACDPDYAKAHRMQACEGSATTGLEKLASQEIQVLDMLAQFAAGARQGWRDSCAANATELARAVGIAVNAMGKVLAQLEAKGLIIWRGRSDVRQWRLSAAGQRLVEGAVH